ncbi:hypothetical protein ACQKWADRAFT_320041 [Trichoderma austrokoningii]
MSAAKFQSPSYRLFEPGFLPIAIKPIIVDVDDEFGSPETLTLRYEEAIQAAQRGDPNRDSPPSDFDMAAYSKAQLPPVNGYDPAPFADTAYEPYSSTAFSAQQADKYAQFNQSSFASNNTSVAQYMPARATAVSFHPSSGIYGTKVHFKILSQDDLFTLSPQAFVLFGSAKCPADLIRDSQDSSGFAFSCSIDAPQPLVTGGNTSVPVSFVIEAPAGGEISRTAAGTFHYLGGSEDDITRADKMPKDGSTAPAPEIDQASASPKAEAPSSAATNTYEYPPQQSQYANTFPQGNNDMISTTYRTTSFSDPHYHHQPRRGHSAWGYGGGGGALASAGRSSSTYDHPTISSRSGLPHHVSVSSSGNNGPPQLVRTSTITAGGGAFHPMYTSKAILKINGNLNDMAAKWTEEEWGNRRRIVQFRKSQHGAVLNVNFKAVPVNERPPNSICISCIWWAEKSDCYVTSVDTIHLLEQLVASPNRFSVEEKNRIRRNLEGFHPVTVSKSKADSEEFFKIIMAFPHPKPRNIEKDVKVFPWATLEPALKKIIGKYSANPSSMMNPVSAPSSYGAPPPGHHGMGSQHGISSQHADSHGQYPMHSSYSSGHHDAMPSPRQASWASGTPYPTGAGRGLSPSLRSHQSPPQSSLRINTSTAQLPAVSTYDARAVASPYASTGLHTPLSHHPAAATPPRWDTAPTAYTDSGYPALSSHQASGAQSVYAAAYNDGPPRA